MSVAAQRELESLSAAEVIDHALATGAGAACITCSFQAEDMIVLHLLRQRLPKVPVVFLETGYHFRETYAYRDRVAKAWELNIINAEAAQPVADQEKQFGVLNQTDPTRCCQLRKVEPLMRALEGYEIWFTGLRREQSPTRRNLQLVENHMLPSGKVLLKVSPLALWDWNRVWSYTVEHGIEPMPLYDLGYRSIGCEPCTSIPSLGADPRSGRWGGAKLECGIHTFSKRGE
jgi:phosphoadenosine phosphosulfate reductase